MTHKNVVCPACACVCDDLDNKLLDVTANCQLAEDWFRANSQPVAEPVLINGKPASLDAGLDRAAAILEAADYPLIYGLSRSSTGGQRAAIELAEKLGAVIDTTASHCHDPSIMALQNVSEVTGTLYRMDGIPPYRACLTNDALTDEDILRRLLSMIPESAEHGVTFLPSGTAT